VGVARRRFPTSVRHHAACGCRAQAVKCCGRSDRNAHPAGLRAKDWKIVAQPAPRIAIIGTDACCGYLDYFAVAIAERARKLAGCPRPGRDRPPDCHSPVIRPRSAAQVVVCPHTSVPGHPCARIPSTGAQRLGPFLERCRMPILLVHRGGRLQIASTSLPLLAHRTSGSGASFSYA